MLKIQHNNFNKNHFHHKYKMFFTVYDPILADILIKDKFALCHKATCRESRMP